MAHRNFVLKYISSYIDKSGEKHYFDEIVPVVEKDIEMIKTKLEHAKVVFNDFTLWGHTFNSNDIRDNGYTILTDEQWFTNGIKR